MIHRSFELTFQVVIYLAIYFFISNLLQLHNIISILITLICIFLFQEKILKFFRLVLNRKFYLFISEVERSLSDFNRKLNRSVDYNELLQEFYNVFRIIFGRKIWAFYVFESGSFHLQKSITSEGGPVLPLEIIYRREDNKDLIMDITSKDNEDIKEHFFDVAPFLENKLDTLIHLEGKNQTIALIFTNRDNLNFLSVKSTSELFYRIVQKSGQILENAALFLDVMHKNMEIKKLFEVSEKILSSLNTDQILDFLLDALDEIIHFDAAAIFLLNNESEQLEIKNSKGYEKDADLSLKLGQGACGWVAQNKTISLLENVTNAEHYYPSRQTTKSQIVLPLQIIDELVGVLCLESDELGYFTNRSIDLLTLFANQAAIALNNAKQYEVSLAKQSLESELFNAGKVQKVLLPKRAPVIKELNISFDHIPSKIVSGDLFDLVQIDNNSLGVIIGDVSGKGAGAAIMMALLLAGFRSYKKSHLGVCEVVAKLNNLLYESTSSGNYATLCFAQVSTEKNQITYSNAGHNPPLLIHPNGSTDFLSGGGIVLGYLENEVYVHNKIPFNKKDLLVFYTDGITEAQNSNDEEFGEDRLIEVLKSNTELHPYELKEKVIKSVKKFAGHKEIDDDYTIVIIKYV